MRVRQNPSRFRKEKGIDFDPSLLFNMEQAAKQTLTISGIGEIPRYYFHMHNIEKVGIHPRASYGDTPMGVYGFPLIEEYLFKLVTGFLPYLSDAKYCTILELIEPEKCLVLDGPTFFNGNVYSNFLKYNGIKNNLAAGSDAIRATRFRNELVRLGDISSVYASKGGIHMAEPHQIVFLSSTAFSVVTTLNASSIVRREGREFAFTADTLWYDKPLFGIPVEIWNRELRLWACDCAERVLPVWEEWANNSVPGYLPQQVRAPRNAIIAVRGYIYGRREKKELATFQAAFPHTKGRMLSNTAEAAINAAKRVLNINNTVTPYFVAIAAAEAAPDSYAEMKWQKAALYTRIKAVLHELRDPRNP